MIIPTGTSALLYVPASIGAVAVPPIFASDATAQVNISSLNSFARSSIIPTCITRISSPAASHAGAFPIPRRSAREAISAITTYNSTLETSSVPRSFPNGVIARSIPSTVTMSTVQVARYEKREHIPDCPAELRTNRRYQKPRACQHQNVLPCERAGISCVFLLEGGSDGVYRSSIRLRPAVELVGKAYRPQQEHDIQRSADGIHHQCIRHCGFADVKRRLYRQHVSAAAHPASAERPEGLPGSFPEHPAHYRKRNHEPKRNRKRGGKKSKQHFWSQPEYLTKIAAQQHNEQHGV